MPTTQQYQMEPLIKGSIYLTDDPGAVQDAMAKRYRIVTMLDPSEAIPFPNTINMSSLLPPPDAVIATLEQEPSIGMQMYMEYLMNPKTNETISCLLAYLNKTWEPCVIYTDHEANTTFNIFQVLYDYFYRTYGVIFGIYGNPNHMFQVIDTPTNYLNILDCIYSNGFMDTKKYALMMPNNVMPSIPATSRLLKDYNCNPKDLDEAMKIAYDVIYRIKCKEYGYQDNCCNGEKRVVMTFHDVK